MSLRIASFMACAVVGLSAFGQAKMVMLGSNNGNPMYKVGSLPSSTSSGGNYQKLKIKIFGGNWHNRNLGDNTYYIASRDGLKINQEVRGGDYERYELKIFDTGTEFVFVIAVNNNWPVFGIESWLLSGAAGLTDWVPYDIQPFNPTGTDVTEDYSVNLIYDTNNSGNIGIGTPASGEKLSVNGTIRSKEVKVEASPWPDYVFEPDYNLRTLEETEEFIKENKHLPEIPSAKEMEANGVQLGEMNRLLLKKIEEMTLYQIEILERLKKAEKRIAQLETENN